MKFKPSLLTAALFGILLLSTLPMCNNPFMEMLLKGDQEQVEWKQGEMRDEPGIISVTGVSLNKETLTLTVGGADTLIPTVEPLDATNKDVTWSTSDDTIATVENGTVTAVNEGTAIITVTTIDGEHTAECEVTVYPAVLPVSVTGITLDSTTLTLAVGGSSQTLIHAVEPPDATNRAIKKWESSNSDIITVNNGTVTAVAEGTATITVTTVDGEHTASCEVTAIVPVSSVRLDQTTLTLFASETETLTATVQPDNATDKTVTWTSSDDTVATVSGGIVTALAEGTATITAAADDANAICTVTVRERNGTPDAPFLIYNETQLRQVGTGTDGWTLSVCYLLMADITLNGEWTVIGSSTRTFSGIFEGNNKTITNLNINKPTADYQGMFAQIGTNGEVKNLTLNNYNVYGRNYTGGVAAVHYGTIENCSVTGNVNGGMGSYVGGIAGESYGTVENCNINGDVSGNIHIGGVVGYNESDSKVENCSFTGNVKGEGSSSTAIGGVGGMAGSNAGTVQNCSTSGDVNGSKYHVGGVVGYNTTGAVKNCFVTGNVNVINASSRIGGVVGRNVAGTVENCYTTGDVSGGEQQVGGVVGLNEYGTVKNCYATGDVSGSDGSIGSIGGVVGSNSSVVENCYATGNVNGGDADVIGGVVGSNGTTMPLSSIGIGTVQNCYATGNISGNGEVGGVAGRNEGGTIKNCYATGNVSGEYSLGGLVGGNGGIVENCYTTGDISGTYFFGGLVGENSLGKLRNCVALNTNLNESSNRGYIGRVVYDVTSVELTRNYARKDMKLNNNATTWAINPTGRNGEDITAEDYHLQSWWSGSPGFDFTAIGAWEWHSANELPILKNFKSGTQNPRVIALTGAGTQADPFLIFTESDLRKVGTRTNSVSLSAHYKLMENITVNGEWTAIGNNSSDNNTTRFTGSFDGNSKTITNLTINKPSADYQGLFGYIGVNGAVKNLMLNNSNVRGKNYAGGVAGYNYGTVEKCYVTGNISGDDYAGGVAGGNRGTVEHCCATGDVSGKTYIGGVAGQNSGTVEYCYATGNIKGNDSGGVVGSNNGTVKNCYATGVISENGGNRGVSGIVGNSTGGILENCVALSPNININGMTYYNERVLGCDSNNYLPTILTNNYARKDMLYNNATVAWASNPSDRHGADITAADYNNQSWWSDAAPNGPGFDFTATGAWEWHSANQLPILKGFTPGTQNPQ